MTTTETLRGKTPTICDHEPGMFERDRAKHNRYVDEHEARKAEHYGKTPGLSRYVEHDGVRMYGGPRDVTVQTWDAESGAPLGPPRALSQAAILAILSAALDTYAEIYADPARARAWWLAKGGMYDVQTQVAERYVVTMAAYSHTWSDLETGTTPATWPAVRGLIDMALTWATTLGGGGTRVTTTWQDI